MKIEVQRNKEGRLGINIVIGTLFVVIILMILLLPLYSVINN